MPQGDRRTSQVPGEPRCVHALLFDPGGVVPVRSVQPVHTAFRHLYGVGPHGADISGLNHTACTLAVYASQITVTRIHARLASGWWPTFARWDWLPTGFLTQFPDGYPVVLPKRPGLPGAHKSVPVFAVFADGFPDVL